MSVRFALVPLLLTAFASSVVAQNAQTVVATASKAMGVDGLDSIVFSGGAGFGNFGQSRTISFGLTTTVIQNFRRAIDFSQSALHETGTAVPPALAGAPPPVPWTYDHLIGKDAGWPDQLQIWVTPWGFLRGAAANGATVRKRTIDEVPYQVVTWVPPQKAPSGQSYRVVGYINAEYLIDRIETWVEHPIVGDLHFEAFFTGYRDFGGIMSPTRITHRQVGMETTVFSIAQVRANPPELAQLMMPLPGATPKAAPPEGPATSEKLADGVYRITGGYAALAVEFRDHVVVIEGGQSEARGLAIIAETKRLFPQKRIRYVVNTHPHFDHASGLAPFAAEGAIVLTNDNSKYFMEQALGSPRTLVGDTLAKSRKKPKVEGVIEKLVLQDAMRTVELHHVQKLDHSDSMLVAYLPKERILFTADFDAPPPGQPVSPALRTLVQNIERLGLDFDRHVTVHPLEPDRPMSRADLLALVGSGK